MKNRTILIFCLLMLCCSCKTLGKIEIGNSIPTAVQANADKNCYTLLNAATIIPLYNYSEYISIGGTDGIVEFIKDETPGKVIGKMKLGDEIISGSDLFKQIKTEIGVGFYIPTDKGWNAFIGDSSTDEGDFKILFFFKKQTYPGVGTFMTYEEYKTWLNKVSNY